jgi:hypothetical protein
MTLSNQIEMYKSGFNETIRKNGQACSRNLWGEVTCPSESSAAEQEDPAASRRALHDSGANVNANFNDIKGRDGILTEYKSLSFSNFYYFDVSKQPKGARIPSEMRGKAAGFSVLGSISAADPVNVFTPKSFDVSSPDIDKDGYLYSIIAGFPQSDLVTIQDVVQSLCCSPSNPASCTSCIPSLEQLEELFPSMVQSFTLRGTRAKRIYLDGFDDIRHLIIISVFGRGVTQTPAIVIDNLVYSNMHSVEPVGPTYSQGFDQCYATSNWQFIQLGGANGNIDTTGAPSSIKLTGSTSSAPNAYDIYQITVPVTGDLSFDWTVTHNDDYWDIFGYRIDGVDTEIIRIDGAGSLTVSVTAGQTFAFYAKAIDSAGSSFNAIISNFNKPC